MKRFLLSMAAVCCLTLSSVSAEKPDAGDKGLCEGDPIGAFYVTKVAGAEDDGVEAGDALCYRCRYGSRPMVMVFTRQTSEPVAKLVKEIDGVVASNKDTQVKGLVTLIGGEEGKLKSDAEAMASKVGSKHVPIVVAKDSKNGPRNYKLSSSDDVTVVIANESQVIARHSFAANKIDVAAVIKEVKSMLN